LISLTECSLNNKGTARIKYTLFHQIYNKIHVNYDYFTFTRLAVFEKVIDTRQAALAGRSL